MFEWPEEERMIRDTVRQFVESEIAPRRDEFEFGDTPPYEVLRKLYKTFGLDVMAREQFKRRLDRADGDRGGSLLGGDDEIADPRARANTIALPMIPIIELCRYSPGMVTALGVSVGLTAAAIMSKGTRAQQERARGRQGHVLHRALGRGRHGPGHDRALPRAVRGLRQGARAVRPADRGVPAGAGEAGAHGSRPPQRREPALPLHRDAGPRPPAHPGRGVSDEALLVARGGRGHPRGRAAVRRQRLHGRVPGRAAGA